ncbi:DUF4180 domain-containing protein [Cohnella luojiensis]|uniref:DUF4180 domain-containing protein n=2 Tax=Cohnella luojiensis TaxID=652876 RepID=A0A4Y8M2D2_9BACL|nr:DUF4180 domain-containing protein [Cohnella luojiensis]
MEHHTSLLMLHADALSDDFRKLQTGLAGQVLQKFINYRIKTAIVIPLASTIKGKFKELMAESNKGNDFRVFDNRIDAENWLINL